MAQHGLLLKFGWLPLGFGRVAGQTLRLAVVGALLLNMGVSGEAAHIVFAGGNWAAIDFGNRCEARSKALWAKTNTEPYAGFAFDRRGARQGEFYVHLSRPARGGATVIATIGTEPFLLVGKGQWALSRNLQQQVAMMAAARSATGLRVESRDSRGSRIVDRYALSSAPTAIDAAAAACAGKSG